MTAWNFSRKSLKPRDCPRFAKNKRLVWETWNMSQAYNCLPTDLWHFDPTTPKGFYFNRGVFYFGRKVSGEMDAAEQSSRKGRKPGAGVDALANGARLGALEKNIGVKIKRHREPDKVGTFGGSGQIVDQPGKQKEERTVVWRESG
jgi:hypothetical protein